ncbi:MAG: glycosyltransferase family 4 protein [Steroidobacteraceae bacterium]
MQTILLVALRGFGVVQSRAMLIHELSTRGSRVLVFANQDSAAAQLDDNAAVEFVDAGFGRRLVSPISDLRSTLRLAGLVRSRRPDLIHFFNAKPTLLGLLAARLAGSRALIVSTVTGLGHAFSANLAVRFLAGLLYRMLFRSVSMTIFQNPDDLALFRGRGWVQAGRAQLIIGSGVDTGRFRPAESARTQPHPCNVLMASRLLRSKGVLDFLQAARQVNARQPGLRFMLAGEAEPRHPDGIDEQHLRHEAQAAGVEFLGYRADLDRLLPQVDLVVLPSYYREGVPRILLEAAACGVAAITTDWPGCREAVVHGVTGLLIAPRDPAALAGAIQSLASDLPALRHMGRAARVRAIEQFDVRRVTRRHLGIYDELLAAEGKP